MFGFKKIGIRLVGCVVRKVKTVIDAEAGSHRHFRVLGGFVAAASVGVAASIPAVGIKRIKIVPPDAILLLPGIVHAVGGGIRQRT